MTQQPFDQQKAIERYTELSRLIQVGAYTERGSNEDYPEDGVEQGVDDLEFRAAKLGLYFHWHEDTKTYTLEPMSPEDLAAFKAAQKAEDEEIARQVHHETQQSYITASDFDTEEDYLAWKERQ